jgi:phi13 family phage major tail protein
MPEVAKEYRINVKNLVYAMLTDDTKTAVTYGTVKPFSSARQVQLSPTLAAGEIFGNGVKEKSISKITGYDLTLDVNKIQIDVRAEILGHTINSDGKLIIGGNDQPKYFAIGYEIEQTGSKRELVWLLKCIAQPFASQDGQSEKDIKFSTDSIKISCVAREFDTNFQVIGDTNYSTFTDAMANTFLSTVPTSLVAA